MSPNSDNSISFWRDRIQASAIHLGISCCIVGCVAFLVFDIWYPYPYRVVAGGAALFVLVAIVDLILGPLITLIIFNKKKMMATLRRDLIVVFAIQLCALSYGLWTVFIARPVHLVFEGDRYRVVSAVDVPVELLSKTPTEIDALPLGGPTVLSLRAFRNSGERMDATLAAMQGLQLGVRPDLWQSYALAIPEILKIARPVSELKTRFPNHTAMIDKSIENRNVDALYLPLIGRNLFWTALLDPSNAEIIAVLPLDCF